MDFVGFVTDETRPEQHFRAKETFDADSNDVSILEFVVLLFICTFHSRLSLDPQFNDVFILTPRTILVLRSW